jgi:hypothetical protein
VVTWWSPRRPLEKIRPGITALIAKRIQRLHVYCDRYSDRTLNGSSPRLILPVKVVSWLSGGSRIYPPTKSGVVVTPSFYLGRRFHIQFITIDHQLMPLRREKLAAILFIVLLINYCYPKVETLLSFCYYIWLAHGHRI